MLKEGLGEGAGGGVGASVCLDCGEYATPEPSA